MSDLFIGLTMLVTLRSPNGAQLRGRVSSVLAGQSLTLRDVYSPSNGTTISEITIKASDIRDLVEATDENFKPIAKPQAQHPIQLPYQPSIEAPATSTLKPFEDPAILRIGHLPASRLPTPLAAVANPPVSGHQPPVVQRTAGRGTSPVTALVDPPNGLSLSTVKTRDARITLGEGSEAEPQIPAEKKRGKRRTRRGAKQISGPMEGKGFSLKDISGTATNRGKGWRQTPILEPAPSFQPFSTLKNRSHRTRKGAYSNGWATEDATDVQDMGDFDFAANLSKFDKRAIFDGIRTDDITADEDRLVGQNRLPKPGTAGGKNLHPTENVLDSLAEKLPWNSEAELSDAEADGASHRDTGSGMTSRRAESQMRKSLSRKDASVHSSQHTPAIPQTTSSNSSFYLVPANRRCEVISALQMLNLENIADSEFGLTEDMMTENAARGIAEVALSALNTGGRRLTQDNGNLTPYVIIYAGNNKSGLRAVAAGRHLRNHGVNIAVVVLGLEREPELLDGLRRQLKVFRNFGGKVFSKVELMEYTKSLGGPVDLIIDGLLGLTISFEELRTGDQATAYELIEWANRSKVNILAIDIPTGIDPSSGKISIIDGKPLYIHSKFVVAMGAPKKGLLQAMGQGDGSGENRAWQLFVADIGIANQAWRKSGTRMRRGAEFEGSWVLGMRFQRGVD